MHTTCWIHKEANLSKAMLFVLMVVLTTGEDSLEATPTSVTANLSTSFMCLALVVRSVWVGHITCMSHAPLPLPKTHCSSITSSQTVFFSWSISMTVALSAAGWHEVSQLILSQTFCLTSSLFPSPVCNYLSPPPLPSVQLPLSSSPPQCAITSLLPSSPSQCAITSLFPLLPSPVCNYLSPPPLLSFPVYNYLSPSPPLLPSVQSCLTSPFEDKALASSLPGHVLESKKSGVHTDSGTCALGYWSGVCVCVCVYSMCVCARVSGVCVLCVVYCVIAVCCVWYLQVKVLMNGLQNVHFQVNPYLSSIFGRCRLGTAERQRELQHTISTTRGEGGRDIHGGGGTYVKWYKSYDNVCLSFHKQLLKLSVGGHHTKKECGAVVAV